jgi:hypothetical protein
MGVEPTQDEIIAPQTVPPPQCEGAVVSSFALSWTHPEDRVPREG